MRVAVYPSVLYGSDFIVESINSILSHVDMVYVVMMEKPWGDTKGVTYKGEWVPWPEKFDDTREKLAVLNHPRVTVLETYKHSPFERWGFAFDLVRKSCKTRIDEVVFIDPDCVFRSDQATAVFDDDWAAHPEYQWASVPQIELWRTPAWQVDRARMMVSLHRGNLDLLVSNTEATRPKSYPLAGRVHNFGFACSPQNTLWKHLTAMSFAPVVGESEPNPRWYDVKWAGWEPGIGDLEPSIRCESAIGVPVPYDVAGLPASIKKRYDAGEWPTFTKG